MLSYRIYFLYFLYLKELGDYEKIKNIFLRYNISIEKMKEV